MGIVNKSYEYKFTVTGYKVPVGELISELDRAKQLIGDGAQASFSYYPGDQREPSTLTVKVTPP